MPGSPPACARGGCLGRLGQASSEAAVRTVGVGLACRAGSQACSSRRERQACVLRVLSDALARPERLSQEGGLRGSAAPWASPRRGSYRPRVEPVTAGAGRPACASAAGGPPSCCPYLPSCHCCCACLRGPLTSHLRCVPLSVQHWRRVLGSLCPPVTPVPESSGCFCGPTGSGFILQGRGATPCTGHGRLWPAPHWQRPPLGAEAGQEAAVQSPPGSPRHSVSG